MYSLDRQVVEEVLEQADLSGEIRDDYRGRGMLTESCFGIVVDQERDGFVLFATMAESEPFTSMLQDRVNLSVAEFAERARVENMGKNLIIFFPGFVVVPS